MNNSQLFQQFIEIHLTGRVQRDITNAANDLLDTFKRRDEDAFRVQTANESKLRQIQEYNRVQSI